MGAERRALERLRRICKRLPETIEVTSWGHPNFKVAKKTFAAFENYKGEWAICFKAEPDQQAFLTEADNRFYVSPYGGRYGWVSARVGPNLDWRQIESLVVGSYWLVAPPRVRADASQRPAKSRRPPRLSRK